MSQSSLVNKSDLTLSTSGRFLGGLSIPSGYAISLAGLHLDDVLSSVSSLIVSPSRFKASNTEGSLIALYQNWGHEEEDLTMRHHLFVCLLLCKKRREKRHEWLDLLFFSLDCASEIFFSKIATCREVTTTRFLLTLCSPESGSNSLKVSDTYDVHPWFSRGIRFPVFSNWRSTATDLITCSGGTFKRVMNCLSFGQM